MIPRSILPFCLLLLVDASRTIGVPLPRRPHPADFEKRAIQALDKGDAAALQQLEKDIARLDGPSRAELRFRLGEKVVEFEFVGVFPFGETQPESLEYLISLNPHKNHETLLAIKQDEAGRLERLCPLFAPQRNDRRTRLLESRLCWMDGIEKRSVSVADVLIEPAETRDDFLKQLEINEHGLGGSQNVKGQRVLLPREKVEALMTLVVPRGR